VNVHVVTSIRDYNSAKLIRVSFDLTSLSGFSWPSVYERSRLVC